jgi:hypothetical protein
MSGGAKTSFNVYIKNIVNDSVTKINNDLPRIN